MSIKELVVRIKFCQAKVRIFASYVPLGILTMFKDLQQMFESSQICMDQAETEEGMVSLKKYHRLIILFFLFQTCRLLLTLPKCCKHKSYNSDGFFF